MIDHMDCPVFIHILSVRKDQSLRAADSDREGQNKIIFIKLTVLRLPDLAPPVAVFPHPATVSNSYSVTGAEGRQTA